MRSQVRALLSPPQSGTVIHGAFFVAKNSCFQRQFEKPTNIPPFRTLQKPLIDPSKTPFWHMQKKCFPSHANTHFEPMKGAFAEHSKTIVFAAMFRAESFLPSEHAAACLFFFRDVPCPKQAPLIGVMTGNDKQNESHFFSLCLNEIDKDFPRNMREIFKNVALWRLKNA